MSRYYDDYVEHSWGTDPKQKAKEKAYNAAYYAQHKAEILARQAKRNAKKAGRAIGEGASAAGRAISEGASAAGRAIDKFGKNTIGIGARRRAEKSAEDLIDARLSNAYAYDDMEEKRQQYLKFKKKKDKESYEKSIKNKAKTQKRVNKANKKADKDYEIYDKSLAGKIDRAGVVAKEMGYAASKKAKKTKKDLLKKAKKAGLYNDKPSMKSYFRAPGSSGKSYFKVSDRTSVHFDEPVVTGTNGVPTKKSKSKASKKKKK